MRVAVMTAPGEVRVEDRPDPVILKPTDAVLRLAATCVCASPVRRALASVEPAVADGGAGVTVADVSSPAVQETAGKLDERGGCVLAVPSGVMSSHQVRAALSWTARPFGRLDSARPCRCHSVAA